MRITRLRVSTTLLTTLGALAAIVPATSAAAAPAPAERVTLPLRDAIAALPQAPESRDGYTRSKFKHWVDEDRDGCNTRAEVLLDEAVEAPVVNGRCSLAGGRWLSYYDEQHVEGARGLDIDHMVPLAESWDSGASAWSPERREAYANDLGDPRSLVAVTARSNRQKSDQDPATWMPPADTATCRYATEWVVVKTRWKLAVDPAERAALDEAAAGCPDEVVDVELAD